MLKQLEYITDDLASATYKAQALLTEFSIFCENCELDGEEAPTEFDDDEKKQLRHITTGARAALRRLAELEAKS